ncbi:MAG: TIGR03000 domain-containing protein [Pirellulales bacterium]
MRPLVPNLNNLAGTLGLFVAALVTCGAAVADDCPKARSVASVPQQRSTTAKSVALRQCAGVYFSNSYSAWFEVDCLVPIEAAVVGVFTMAEVPQAGKLRLWITRVYEHPKTSPPSGAQPPSEGGSSANDAVGELAPASAPSDPDEEPSEDTPTDLDAARFHLRLPPGVRLTVDGQTVASLPLERDVVIRGLESGQRYDYHFVAELDRDGHTRTVERTVSFTAGDEVLLDLAIDPQLLAGE